MARIMIAPAWFLSLLFLGEVAAQAVAVEVPEAQLVKKSQVVIVGEVIGQRSYWNGDGSMIYTDCTVLVRTVLKGSLQTTEICLRLEGGEVGTYSIIAAHMPQYSMGEVAIMYLKECLEGTMELTHAKLGTKRVSAGRIEGSNEALEEWATRIRSLVASQKGRTTI